MTKDQIKTASHLRAFVEEAGHAPHFFTPRTMRFWGDTMANYGARLVDVQPNYGAPFKAWELYRRRPVKHGIQSSAYFCAETFRQLHLPR